MSKGFSLIEILIALIIISILSSITLSGYSYYIADAKRSDGKLALLDLANRMEHYYLKHNTYEMATIGKGTDSDVLNDTLSPAGWYRLSINKATPDQYTLKATPMKARGAGDTSLILESGSSSAHEIH